MTKKSILKGTIIISIAGLIARFIGLFFRIPLTAMIGEEGIGIYSFPMTLFVPMAAIVMQGPPTVIAKMISEKNAVQDEQGVYSIYKSSQKLMLLIGFFATLMMIISAPVFSRYIWSDEVLWPYLALSLAPLFLSVVAIYTGLYQGLQDMRSIAIQQLFDGFGRLTFGLLLTYLLLPKGINYATTAAVFGTTIGALTGMIAILVFHKFSGLKLKTFELDKQKIRKYQKTIFKTSLPITIGAIGASLVPLVDALLLHSRLEAAGFLESEIFSMNGVLSNINALINVPLIIGVAISLNIVPNIAAAKVTDRRLLQNRMRSGIIMITSLAVPSGIGLLLTGKTIFKLFYPSMTNNYYLIEVLSFSIIITMINQAFIAILQGTDHEKVPVKNFYIGLFFKVVLSYILLGLPSVNIHGAAISTFASYLLILFLNYRVCVKKLNFKLDVRYMLILPVVNTTIMGIIVYAIQKTLIPHLGYFMPLMLAIGTGAAIYGILLIRTKVVGLKDIPILNKLIRK